MSGRNSSYYSFHYVVSRILIVVRTKMMISPK